MWKCDPKLDVCLSDGVVPNVVLNDITKHVAEISDALADLIYVVLYTANRYDIDLAPVWNEVQRSNMTKVGGHMNEAGKWVKPDSYSPANLEPIILEQLGYGN